MQFLVRHALRLFGAPISDDADVLSAHEEIRAPSRCITRKAAW
jgi:hypothetical protein